VSVSFLPLTVLSNTHHRRALTLTTAMNFVAVVANLSGIPLSATAVWLPWLEINVTHSAVRTEVLCAPIVNGRTNAFGIMLMY
jgi:hypothetical protein